MDIREFVKEKFAKLAESQKFKMNQELTENTKLYFEIQDKYSVTDEYYLKEYGNYMKEFKYLMSKDIVDFKDKESLLNDLTNKYDLSIYDKNIKLADNEFKEKGKEAYKIIGKYIDIDSFNKKEKYLTILEINNLLIEKMNYEKNLTLEQLRKLRGITKEEISTQIGISRSNYDKRIYKKTEFKKTEIEILCNIFHKTLDDMFEIINN